VAEDGAEAGPQPIFDAHFGHNIGKKKFYSAEEFAKWAIQNRTAYHWLSDLPSSPGRDAQWVAVDRLAAAAETLQSAIVASDPTNVATARSAALNIVEKYYRKKYVLAADDPRTVFLANLAQADKLGAVAALTYFMGQISGTPSDPKQLASMIRAIAFELGIRDTAESEKATLDLLAKEWQRKTSDLGDAFAKAEVAVTRWTASSNQAYSDNQAMFVEAQDKRVAAFEKLLKESGERLEKIEKWYAAELGLHSAVKYWGQKGKIHRALAALAAIATASAAFVYFTIVLPSQFSSVLAKLKVDANDSNWRIGVAAGLILLGIWLVRILVRLTLSQIHLATDAAHRRVVIHTYLALLRNETQAVTADDRSKVLEVVFRPVSDGVVRDDAMPPSPWEVVTRPPK
jgi:hypothetical protein